MEKLLVKKRKEQFFSSEGIALFKWKRLGLRLTSSVCRALL